MSASSSNPTVQSFLCENVNVYVFESKAVLGAEAAKNAAIIIRQAIAQRQLARVIVATGNSQLDLIEALGNEQIDWNCVELFHMDEYVSMSESHTASFRRWIKQRLVERVHPAHAHYIEGDAADIEEEMKRYAALLLSQSIDLAFVGFGENGHIAFNDPPADFQDPQTIKRVTLDEACRRQQFNEGHFPTLEAVPTEAITLTCPALLSAKTWICSVPDQRKAKAVRCALQGPITPTCPASLVRTHPNAFVYLDQQSASLLDLK